MFDTNNKFFIIILNLWSPYRRRQRRSRKKKKIITALRQKLIQNTIKHTCSVIIIVIIYCDYTIKTIE